MPRTPIRTSGTCSPRERRSSRRRGTGHGRGPGSTGARAAKLAAAPVADAPAYGGADIVRRALRVVGEVDAAASALSVIDARRRSTLAVGSAPGYVAAALAGDGFRVRLDVARASEAEQD